MVDNKAQLITPEQFTTFGELLSYLRHRAALTQRELATQVGYHYSYLSRLERGERFPEAAMILARFVPALQLEKEPEWAARLVELAQQGRGESSPTPPAILSETTTTTAVSSERLPIPPTTTTGAPPNPSPDLPHPLTRLLGREHEVAILRQLLANPDVRLLTLTGPPGIGKTRLALQTAVDTTPLFPQEPLFIDLSGVRDPQLFPSALLQALNLPETAGHMAESALIEALQAREQLLILDNFEQIIPAAPVVSRLLRRAPRLKILVTSREILRLNGENEFVVPALPVEPELGAPAVRLFVQRAQAAQPTFQLTAANETAVAELCQRLDGLPLAIELAAARIKLFTPEAMLARLDKRFTWLTGGKRDDHDWRQTMRGAIDWSYQLLTADEKRLWEALSVFMSGGTLTAIDQICGGDWETLVALSEKNLITLRPARSAEDDLRFGWLESLREFAAERLACRPDRHNDLSRAHAEYFRQLVAAGEAARTEGKHDQWLTRLDEAYSNIRAALTWAVAQRQGELALSLCADLIDYWEVRGHFAEGRHWLKAALALAPDEPSTLLGLAWRGYARLILRQNDFSEAITAYRRSVAVWQALGDDRARANGLLDLGRVLATESQPAPDLAIYFQEALSIYQKLGDWRGTANALNQLGLAAYNANDFPAAHRYFTEALVQRRAAKDQVGIANALNNLGLAAHALSNYAAAAAHHQEALHMRQAQGLEGWLSQSYANLALALLRLGQTDAAEEMACAATRLSMRLGIPLAAVEAAEILALAAATRQQVGRAAHLLAAGKALREKADALHDSAQEADIAWALGLLGTAVGSDEWQQNWVTGSTWTVEQLVDYALNETTA